MSYRIIIPARYGSNRFPGKPLAMLAGKPVVQHVYEHALECGASQVVIATDDKRIEKVAETFGAAVLLTSSAHESGTARIAEVIDILSIKDDEIIVNLQGDEPFMPSACIDQVADLLSGNQDCEMATLCHTIHTIQDVDNPDIVKLVMDQAGYVLYFSRAAIPFHRSDVILSMQAATYYRHIGLYAYTSGFLRRYARMSACTLESVESLEQLRVLFHGERIKVGVTDLDTGIGIDTPEDLQRAELML